MIAKQYKYHFFFLVSLLFLCPKGALANDPPIPILSLDTGYITPVYSPDGESLLISRVGYNTISIFDIKKEEFEIVSGEPGSGFGYTWNYNGTQVAYKVNDLISSKYNLNIYHITDKTTQVLKQAKKITGTLSFSNTSEVIYNDGFGELTIVNIDGDESKEEHIYTVNKNRIEKVNVLDKSVSIIYLSEKSLLNLVVSPNDQFLAFEEYGGDLLIIDVESNSTIRLDTGNKPQISPNSEQIVYMKTTDDGHQLNTSDIYMADIQSGHIQNLTADFNDLALRPTWHPDGKSIIFDTGGFGPIYILKVE